jgi:hypothetical protein
MKIEIETYPTTNRNEINGLLFELKEKFINVIKKIRIIEEL